jgi:DNA modification methylase
MNKLELNKIYLGDAIKILRNIPSESVDLICTDPPYNLGKDYGNNIDLKEWTEYIEFTKDWLAESKRVLKQNGSIYVFMGVRFIARLNVIMEDYGFLFNGWITWHYTQGVGRKKGFSPRHEDILYFTKSDDFTFNIDSIRIPQKFFRERNNMQGANPGDVWSFSHVHYSNPERTIHPTQKPEALIKRIILASSNENDVVLDMFLGSGTTCVVAKKLNRKWIGIELNPEFVKIAEERIQCDDLNFDSYDERENRKTKDLKTNEIFANTVF